MDTLSDKLAEQLQEEPAKTGRFLDLKAVLMLVVGIVIGGVSACVLLMSTDSWEDDASSEDPQCAKGGCSLTPHVV